MSGIAEVVKNTMEALSDAVAQMMLIVVPLQEANSPMGPELPNRAKAVGMIANKMAEVADNLAQEEYGEYPDIQVEMKEATRHVREQVAALNRAINELSSTNDRRQGWNIFVNSCSNISLKTVLLLKIVYGVEIKRLLAASREALDSLAKVHPEECPTDPKKFVGDASEAATKLAQLAQYTRDKAAEAGMPEESANTLRRAADEQEKASNNLLNSANHLLQKRDDPQRQAEVRKRVEEGRDAVQYSVNPLAAMKEQLDALSLDKKPSTHQGGDKDGYSPQELAYNARKAEQLLRQLQDPATDQQDVDKIAKDLNRTLDNLNREVENAALVYADEPVRGNAMKKQFADVREGGDDAVRGKRQGQDVSQPVDATVKKLEALVKLAGTDISPQAYQARLLREDLNGLQGAVSNGETNAAAKTGKRVVAQGRDLADAKGPEQVNAENAKRANANLKQINDDIGKDMVTLRDTLKNVKDPNKKGDFEDANQAAKATCRQVEAYAGPNEADQLDAAMDQCRDILGKLQNAVEAGDMNERRKLANDLEKENDNLQSLIAKNAARTTDPARRDQERATGAEIAQRFAELRQAAEDPNVTNVRKEINNADAALDKLRDLAASDALGAANAVKLSSADLASAGAHRDRPAIKDNANRLMDSHRNFIPLARRYAHTEPDPAKRERINNGLGVLNALIPEYVELSQGLLAAENSGDKEAARRYVKEMEAIDNDISDVLDDVVNAIRPGMGKKSTTTRSAAGGGDNFDLPPHLREMLDACKILERLIPELVICSKKVHDDPGKDANKDELRGIVNSFRDPLATLRPDPREEDSLTAVAEKLKNDVEKLSEGAKRGAPAEVVMEARNAANAKGKLVPLATKLAEKTEDPLQRKRLLEACNAIDAIFPHVIECAKRVVRNPMDQGLRFELDKANLQMQNAIASIIENSKESPEENVLRNKDELRKALRALRKHVEGAQKREALDEAKRIGRTDFYPIRMLVNQHPDRPDLADKLNKLEKIAHDLADNTDRAVGKPVSSADRKKLEEDVQEMERILDDLPNATSAVPIVAAKKEMRDISKLVNDLDDNASGAVLADGLRALVGDHKELIPLLKEAADKEQDPQRKQALEKAITDMEGQITDAVMKTKAVLADPSDDKKKSDAKKALTNLQVPLANAIDALSPSKLSDLKKLCREVDAETQSVGAAAKDGDKQAVKSLLDDLKKNNEDLEKLANARAAELASTDPIQSESIRKALKDVESAQDSLKHAARDVLANPNNEEAQRSLDNAVDKNHNALRNLEAAAEGKSVGQDVADGSNKLDDMLNNLAKGNLTLEDLLKMAADLSSLFGGMIDKVTMEALRERAAARGVDINTLLDELANLADRKEKPKEIEKVPELPPRPIKAAPAPARDAPFHEHVEHAATVISNTAANLTSADDKLRQEAGSLTDQLMRLARAAKEGNRQEIIHSGQAASKSIRELVKELRRVASTITDKRMKDRLLWLASMLLDLSTNMKILCSVKAACGSPDNDDQIVSVINSIRNALTESVDTINIATRAKKRQV